MTRITVVAAFLAALPCAAFSETVDCSKAETQVDMTACAEKDWNAADARMNASYKAAIVAMKGIDANLDASDRGAEAALRTAQRTWVTFRDQNCAVEGWAAHGGTAEPMLIYACRARLTAARADELDNMNEGD